MAEPAALAETERWMGAMVRDNANLNRWTPYIKSRSLCVIVDHHESPIHFCRP